MRLVSNYQKRVQSKYILFVGYWFNTLLTTLSIIKLINRYLFHNDFSVLGIKTIVFGIVEGFGHYCHYYSWRCFDFLNIVAAENDIKESQRKI